MIAQINEDIPLSFQKIVGGVIQTGLSVEVIVRDVVTGALLLSAHAMVEVTPGLYTYLWVGGQSVKKHCVAIYTVNSKSYDEFFEIDDEIEQIEIASQDGVAT